MKVIVTAPHGNKFLNDVIAGHIIKHLVKLLDKTDIQYETFINEEPRSSGDQNRPPARDSPYREALRESLVEGADLLLDIHGFPNSTTSPFKGHDIVVLRSYKTQGTLPAYYYYLLKNVSDPTMKVGLLPATAENDVVKEALEHGIPAILIEHNESQASELLAKIHCKCLKIIQVENGL